ncbi:MAG TPA: hypothetical protein VF518_15945, partial [Polyangia bacterium]
PLLLVALPPLQDLPNHVATAHIIAHPEIYPQFIFNGYFKANSLLTLWLQVFGGYGLLGAARAFAALALAANALALPIFVLRFSGRRRFWTCILFAWPLVHGFFMSMGMLNFVLAFALSLVLLVYLDRQRERPSWWRGLGLAGLGGVLWYAHPFPLLVAAGLVALHAALRPTWHDRVKTASILLAPLLPVGLLMLASAQQHLVKASPTRSHAGPLFAYLPPWETLAHVWLDASGAFTRWGSVTVVPAVLLAYYAWKQRRIARPFFSSLSMAGLTVAYLALPTMISNWWYLNCRLVPFLWVGAIARLPDHLPKTVRTVLALCALWFSVTLGIDTLRLDRDRAAFAAGIDAVPMQATLLPLLFKQRKTSDFTASLTHAWADYVIAKNTSAPLVFAVERSYPITYREFPPAALIPPALDEMAEKRGTPAQVCKRLRPQRPQVDRACLDEWRREWATFWQQAEPRFSHLLTWAMPDEARPMIPSSYHLIFAADALEIFERTASGGATGPVGR